MGYLAFFDGVFFGIYPGRSWEFLMGMMMICWDSRCFLGDFIRISWEILIIQATQRWNSWKYNGNQAWWSGKVSKAPPFSEWWSRWNLWANGCGFPVTLHKASDMGEIWTWRHWVMGCDVSILWFFLRYDDFLWKLAKICWSSMMLPASYTQWNPWNSWWDSRWKEKIFYREYGYNEDDLSHKFVSYAEVVIFLYFF